MTRSAISWRSINGAERKTTVPIPITSELSPTTHCPQLLTSTNPESGTISYAYDANGNVSTKTDCAERRFRHGHGELRVRQF